MKAAVSVRYGPPELIRIQELPTPRPAADEIMVRVRATTVSRSDVGMLRARPFFVRAFCGLTRPRITTLGLDFAGEVVAAGGRTTRFRRGDRVFGLSPDRYGAHAEYLCLPETAAVAAIPEGLSYGEAVVAEGVWYATSALEAAGVAAGDRVLIYGASGAIGTAAVQLARLRGAEVTAVVAGPQRELAATLGADFVVDFTVEDFTRIGRRFDFVFDAVGKTTYFRCRRLLADGGTYAASDLGPFWQNPLLAGWYALTRRRCVIFPLPGDPRAIVAALADQLASGAIRAVVDRRYTLDEIRDAYRYVESGRKTGIVVIAAN